MKAIFLFGHLATVTAAYRHLDALLRKHNVNGIALAMVASVDADTAASLRLAGGQLWFCAPSDTPAAEGESARAADRRLIVDSWHMLAQQAADALHEFLGTGQATA
jgi:hypothetical protein